jgi:hypothetical protein
VGMMTVYNTQKLEAFQHVQKQKVYRNAYKSLIIMVQ